MTESLRGQLLIAAPQLSDYFRRTVVLVVEHSDDGAMGLVLNRPTETEVAQVAPELALRGGRKNDVVYAGGPVQPEAVVVLGDFEEPAEAGTLVTGPLGLLDPARPDSPLRRLRVFAGYAGWAPGQLDSELEADAWVLEPAAPDDPFAGGDLWPSVVQRKGGDYALWASMPFDPGMN